MKGLGGRIEGLRKSKQLTLLKLSQMTGIDQATLSRIENGRMTGTLDSHMKIAEALDVRLPDLYNQVLATRDETKEKAARQKLETFSHSSGAVTELLTSGILQKKMMPALIKIKAKGHTEKEEFPRPTERFIYILKGSIEVYVAQEKRPLKAGESLYFDASLPHYLRNAGASESTCLSIMTPVSL